MPYHRHRRTECNTGRRDPGVAVEPLAPHSARSLRGRCQRSAPDRRNSDELAFALLARGASTRVEYLIRPARITDIERLVALGGGAGRASAPGPLDSGDLLRQLVYLPQASIFIAEARREVVGGAVLALRPSARAGGFVDVANIFYAAKAAGTDIDYVTLLKAATAGRDFVRAYAYTGLDPENENQRNFHAFLARNHYKVVSKDIRKYGDGKVKANLDIELVVDLMKTARNLDIAIVVSGDGDFAPAIRAVQEMGVRVEVISFRGNTSSDLIDVADLFTDITQLARVDKSSSRSGRRVAGDEEDLSMTEVPDKQTEGSGTRARGRGRGRGRAGEAEPVAASAASGSGRRGAAATAGGVGASGLLVLPGERFARAA